MYNHFIPNCLTLPPPSLKMSSLGNNSATVYFGSGMGADMALLSNFALAPFEFAGINWNSSEHAFQALLRVAAGDCHRFAVGGDLDGGDLQANMRLLLGPGTSDEVSRKKAAHWGAKLSGKVAMVGIVAKMAVKTSTAKRLGIQLLHPAEGMHSIESMGRLFDGILDAKYAKNASHRTALLGTAGKTLVEFDRGARAAVLKGLAEPLWTAYVAKETEADFGMTYGLNLQGRLQMDARARLSSALSL